MADKNFGHDENKNLVNLDNWVKQYMSESQLDVAEIKEKVENMWSTIYPVGSIYLSINPANPETIWGGTWVLWGSGRVPVCYNGADNDFKTVEQVGGSKALASHNHTWGSTINLRGASTNNYTPEAYHATKQSGSGRWSTAMSTTSYNHNGWDISISGTTSSAGTGNSGNLQPYIVCYMWKRTA